MKKTIMAAAIACAVVVLVGAVIKFATAGSAPKEKTVVRVGAMSGPTAMGMVKLMSLAEEGKTENTYEFADLSKEASAFVSPLATGEIDIAAVPSNLASVVYNNTDGGIRVLAVNTLGVLNIVERGKEIEELADLSGKTIYATGQGATPEYTLHYLLQKNGLDPDKDVTIKWCVDTTEALSYVAADKSAIAMLPQPFATAACTQVDDLRIAIDLNDAWVATGSGCNINTGVVVARSKFIEENPEIIETFLKEYEASVENVSTNPDETAALIEGYGIIARAAIAKKALPGCNITFLAGDDMKASLKGYLQILYDYNPKAVGGALPEADFYYGAAAK